MTSFDSHNERCNRDSWQAIVNLVFLMKNKALNQMTCLLSVRHKLMFTGEPFSC